MIHKLRWTSKDHPKQIESKMILKDIKKIKSKNLLFHADNLDAMNYLLKNGLEGKIDLLYIDPPFGSGENYYFRSKNTHDLAFKDVAKGETKTYLNIIYPRLKSIQKLMSPSGSLFIHLDWHTAHYVKVIMDEIFGYENFRNEIIVKRGRRKNLLTQFKSIARMHNSNDSILWYSKSSNAKFPHPVTEYESRSKWMGFWSNVNRPTMRYNLFNFTPERGQWKWSRSRSLKAIKNYKVYQARFGSLSLEEYWRKTDMTMEFIRKRKGVKYPEYWVKPKTHRVLDNVWMDIESYSYSTGYSTQKHTALLERIIGQFSRPASLVADFFCGSGTTLVVADKLGRQWIGCDSSPMAIKVATKRLRDFEYMLIKL
jgi:adenine-specific DNA-methyltransferase